MHRVWCFKKREYGLIALSHLTLCGQVWSWSEDLDRHLAEISFPFIVNLNCNTKNPKLNMENIMIAHHCQDWTPTQEQLHLWESAPLFAFSFPAPSQLHWLHSLPVQFHQVRLWATFWIRKVFFWSIIWLITEYFTQVCITLDRSFPFPKHSICFRVLRVENTFFHVFKVEQLLDICYVLKQRAAISIVLTEMSNFIFWTHESFALRLLAGKISDE